MSLNPAPILRPVYGETPDQVARSVSEIIRIGAVGINLEEDAYVVAACVSK